MKNLIKAAEELNKKLGLNPAIKTKGVKKDALEELLLEAADEVKKSDNLSEETYKTLESIGAEFPWREEDEEEEVEEEEVEDTDDDDDEDLEEDEDEEDEDEEENDLEEEEEEAPKKGKKGVKEEKKGKKEEKAPAKKPAKDKGASAYGTAIDIMCANPDITLQDLYKKVEKAGIDTKSKKSAINTAYSGVRKVVSLLRKAGYMKK